MPPVSVELKKQVKAANDIVDVVSGYIQTHPAGKVFKAVCPFHNDTRPSLQIDRQYQNYRCWACDARGDVFDFVMKHEKVEFPEALRILAERAGIRLDPQVQSPEDQVRGRLLDAMRWAEAKYQACYLDDPLAEDARDYLGGRKLSGATVRQFGLGFAPVTGDWLVRLAAKDGVPPDVLVEVGLIAARDEGRGYYDRFRDRVMFPIRDVRGQTVGFGGRILPGSPLAARAPKYYNSAETPLFRKSDLIYGLDLARHAGSAEGFLAVVEGYTDVMMAHQCGVANVVATMGTALTVQHVLQLRRYVPKVVLVFDGDEAGDAAADKALELFWAQHDFGIAVTTLPDGKDPCDLLSGPDGSAEFVTCLTSATDVLQFKLDSLLRRHSEPSVENTKRIVDSVLGVLALAPAIPSASAQVKQELLVSRLAHRLGLRQETVWARLAELRRERQRRDAQPAAPAKPAAEGSRSGPAHRAEQQLLELLLAEPGLVPAAAEGVSPETLSHSGLRRMLSELYALQAAGQSPDFDALRVRLIEIDRPDLVEAALRLQFKGRHTQDRPEYLRRVIDWFAKDRATAEKKSIKEQLATAPGDDAKAIELLRRL
ncbi:MAG TPA: DNA primase, partial [Fimbriiglobus sp.]|nr:DNA primase [Fimbriiglobus sp.]